MFMFTTSNQLLNRTMMNLFVVMNQ